MTVSVILDGYDIIVYSKARSVHFEDVSICVHWGMCESECEMPDRAC